MLLLAGTVALVLTGVRLAVWVRLASQIRSIDGTFEKLVHGLPKALCTLEAMQGTVFATLIKACRRVWRLKRMPLWQNGSQNQGQHAAVAPNSSASQSPDLG